MKFTLQRIEEVDSLGVTGITGTLVNDFGFSCLTLENKLTLCPAGTYPLKYGFMWSHDSYRAELEQVPGHTGVFVHSGEKATDSHMCPLVGDHRPTHGTLGGGLVHHIADRIAQLVKDNPDSTIEILPIPEHS